MERSIAELDARMVATINAQGGSKRIRQGFDYIIAAELDPDFKGGRGGAASEL